MPCRFLNAGLCAMAAWLLSGCALLEVPTFEDMRQQQTAAARIAISDAASAPKRAAAAKDLGLSDDPTVQPLLVAALRDPAPEVRTAATRALHDLGGNARAAAPELMAALQAERDPEAAVAMGWQLTRWDADLTPATASLRAVLAQPDLLWRYHAAVLLSDLVPAAEIIPVYLAAIGTGVADAMRNKPQDLIERRIPFDGAAIWPLLEQAAGDSNAQRRAAAMSLARHYKPFPAAGPPLLARGLRDADARVRAAAAWSCLMATPEPEANGSLLKTLLEDPDAEVRANASRALGQLAALGRAPTGSREALGLRMADASPRVREYAANALGSLRDLPAPVVGQITARLDARTEPDATVRAAAAAALGFVKLTPDVQAALRRGFDDVDLTVRERCMATTGHLRISEPEVLQALAARTTPAHSLGERLTALGALRDIGPAARPAREAVLRAQQDPDPNVREGAGYALEQMDR